VGYLDLSPIAALGVLSLVSRVFGTLASHGKISAGIILALVLQALWGAVSFFLGFLIIILVLRLIAHFLKQGVHNSFWRVVDAISQPVLFRINRIIFGGRIVNFTTGLIISITSLGASYIVLGILVSFVSGMLARLPI
jgi:YggT family protein